MSLCQCGCGEPAPLAPRSNTRRGYVKGQAYRYIFGHQMRGRTLSPEHRAKVSAAKRGRALSAEGRRRVAAANARRRGRPLSEATRQRMSESRRGRFLGVEHHNWRGDSVSYSTLHAWVRRHKPKTGVCTECHAQVGTGGWSGTQWANISGRYRRDLNDFIELCIPCHRERDRQARAARRLPPSSEQNGRDA